MGTRVLCKKCNDIIESKYRHDFVACKCGAIFVDGGNDYLRMGGLKEDYKILTPFKGKDDKHTAKERIEKT